MNAKELKETDPRRFEKEYYEWVNNEPYEEWWDYVEEGFKEKVAPMGITVAAVFFNGFYCQGSYAAFIGRIDAAMFMEHTKLSEEYYPLYLATKDDGSYARVTDRNNQGNIRVNYDSYANQTGASGVFSDLDQEAWEELIDQQEKDCALEAAMQDFCDDLCHELFRNLQTEYEYLTSEEQYIEYCEANDITFEGEETCAS